MAEDKYNIYGDLDGRISSMDASIDKALKLGKESKAVTSKKTRTVAIIIIAAVVVAIIAALCIIIPKAHANKYDEAMEAYNNQNFAEAAVLFEELGEYENSSDLFKECKYNIGLDYLANEEYKKAAAEFKASKPYKDSKKQLKKCNYNLGKQALNEGDYEAAIKYLHKSEGYKDSYELYNNAYDKLYHDTVADSLEGLSFSGTDGPTHSMDISFSYDKYKRHDHHHSLIDGSDYDENDSGKWTVSTAWSSGGYTILLDGAWEVDVIIDESGYADHIAYHGAGIDVELY